MMSPGPSSDGPPSGTEKDNCLLACAQRLVKRGRPSIAEAEQLSGKILEASWQVLLETGFDGFTFDRVARHAHIGKATIYSRFANKRELMETLLAHSIERRHALIMAQGDDLPFVEAFTLRATEALALLL